MWKLLLLAGTGGFIGASARFLINRLFTSAFNSSLPWATFTINLLGCLIFGMVSGIMMKTDVVSPKLNAFLIVGFCGGFTTFSTFSAESFNLMTSGEILVSLSYIGLSVILGLLAVGFGIILTR